LPQDRGNLAIGHAGDAVRALGNPMWIGLLITYAKEGGRPDWMEGEVPRPVAIRRAEPFEVKNATVVSADIVCDNGIVHVIDRVILPG
jgi:hypothetical protein